MKLPSSGTLLWGVAFGLLAIALANRFDPIGDVVYG